MTAVLTPRRGEHPAAVPPTAHAPDPPGPRAARRPTGPPVPVVLRAAPRREPPFDDELPPDHVPPGRHERRLPFPRPPAAAPASWRTRPPARTGLPDPATWGRRLLVGLIETADGRRPLPQLAALLSPSIAAGLGADLDRCGRAGGRHWLHRATVRSVRAGRPDEGVAEVAATLEVGGRVRAVALRLEVHHGRWRVTRLQLG